MISAKIILRVILDLRDFKTKGNPDIIKKVVS